MISWHLPDEVLQAIEKDWQCLRSAGEWRADTEVVLAAASQSLEALHFAKGDLGALAQRAAVPPGQQLMEEEKEAWTGLEGAEEAQRRAKEKKAMASEWNHLMLQLAPEHGRALSYMRPTGVDRDLTCEAVRRNGTALVYAQARNPRIHPLITS